MEEFTIINQINHLGIPFRVRDGYSFLYRTKAQKHEPELSIEVCGDTGPINSCDARPWPKIKAFSRHKGRPMADCLLPEVHRARLQVALQKLERRVFSEYSHARLVSRSAYLKAQIFAPAPS